MIISRILLILGLFCGDLCAQTDLAVVIAQLLQSGAIPNQAVIFGGTTWNPGNVGGVATAFTGTSITFTHNLRSAFVQVAVYDVSGVLIRPALVTRNTINVVTVLFDGVETGVVVVK